MADDSALADLTCCALMGTAGAGAGTGVVVATGAAAEFGRIALGLGERHPETDFQTGLRHFSVLLLQVAVGHTSLTFVINLVLDQPLLQSLLVSLAIAVGITPQLLPAVVSTSLATGSRRLAKRHVLVKRLVCIEDLGDMDVLVTDKTVAIGVTLPMSSLSELLGFAPLPLAFFLALVAMTVGYLVLIEFAKRVFFANQEGRLPRPRRRGTTHRQQRRAERFSTGGGLRVPGQVSIRPSAPAPSARHEPA